MKGRLSVGFRTDPRGPPVQTLSRFHALIFAIRSAGERLARFSHITRARAREFAQGFVGVFRTSFKVAPETRGRWNHWWCCGCSEEEAPSGPSVEAAG